MRLRRVEPPAAPLSPEEMQKRGDELVTRARAAAIDAMRASMVSAFLDAGKVPVVSLGKWRDQARAASEAWALVDATVSELLTELARTRAAMRGDR